jgi:hypothetical protein
MSVTASKAERNGRDQAGVPPPYASKIIKAGALLADTKALLAHWDVDRPPQENLRIIQHDNLFGKASRSRVRDILAIFRQRYLSEQSVAAALVVLANNKVPSATLDRILYFHAAQSDRLLHDVVIEVVGSLYLRGRTEIRVEDVQSALRNWVGEGKTTARWSDETTVRVAQGLLATLRDFGILQGANNKRLAPPYLPISAFAYVAFYLRGTQASGERLIQSEEWKLFFLSTNDVERLFMEAHQRGLLEYYAAGPVIRITFPSESLEDYARVISERAI